MASMEPRWKTETEEIRPYIFTSNKTDDPIFYGVVVSLLEQIEKNPIGKKVLEKIRVCASEVLIVHGSESICYRICGETKEASLVVVMISMKVETCFSTEGEVIPFPTHVVLFHELTHAYHYISGRDVHRGVCDPLVWESDEEYNTIVGFSKGCFIGDFSGRQKITENAFRKAEGLPERCGDWTPSNSNSISVALCVARMKILRSIREQTFLAFCSVQDLGLSNRIVLRAEVQGVDIDYSAKDTESTFFVINQDSLLDSLLKDKRHRRLQANDCPLFQYRDCPLDSLESTLAAFLPRLKLCAFKVNALILLRLTQQEFDVLSVSVDKES